MKTHDLKPYDLIYYDNIVFSYIGYRDGDYLENISSNFGVILNRFIESKFPYYKPITKDCRFIGHEGHYLTAKYNRYRKINLLKLKSYNPDNILNMLKSQDKDSVNFALEILRNEGII